MFALAPLVALFCLCKTNEPIRKISCGQRKHPLGCGSPSALSERMIKLAPLQVWQTCLTRGHIMGGDNTGANFGLFFLCYCPRQINEKSPFLAKLSLCLTKHCAMKTYGGVGV
jgi:hypothetical protein